MTAGKVCKLLLLCTAHAGLVMVCPATAHADPAAAPIIPAATQKSPDSSGLAQLGAAPAELPLPYTAWAGSGFRAPPPAAPADLPLPLARAPELRRRPFELGLSPAAFLPNCGSGSIDASSCGTVQAGAGLEASLVYRAVPFFGFGLEAALSGFGGQGHGALSATADGARYGGVLGRLYFADAGAWDPYASLSIGYGSLDLQEGERHGRSSGWGGRVAGGVDYVFGGHFRLGPTLGLAHFISWSEHDCDPRGCSARPLPYGRLLGFANFGLRFTASWGALQ